MNLKIESYTVRGKDKVEEGIQIAGSTPGRCLDMIKQRKFNTEHLKYVIIDEADEIFSRGFHDHINDIVKFTPEETRIIMSSSTIPIEILEFMKQIRREPAMIEVRHQEFSLKDIKQYYIAFDSDEWKFDTLVELFENIGKVCFGFSFMEKFSFRIYTNHCFL